MLLILVLLVEDGSLGCGGIAGRIFRSGRSVGIQSGHKGGCIGNRIKSIEQIFLPVCLCVEDHADYRKNESKFS